MHIQRLILAGGCCLAFGAAFANIGVVLETGISVSHLTGDISRVSMDLSSASPALLREALFVGGAALSFLVGAFLTGYLIHHPTLDFARPYGRAVTGIGLLFIASGLLLPGFSLAGIALAAFGCGVQNSLASSYRGIVLRTTHLSGLVTDFGIALGMKARGFEVDAARFVVPGLLIVSFFCGGVVSGMVFFSGKWDVILLAGCGYVLAGVAWSVGKHFVIPRFLRKRGEVQGE
jgi:uncharacterized membrane protein YoaK (UPF0700 family)